MVLPPHAGRARATGRVLGGDGHLGAGLEPVGAVGHHLVAGCQPLRHHHVGLAGGAGGHGAHLHRVVGLHQVDEVAVRAGLDRPVWHQGGTVQGLQQQAGVDELVREQGLVGVGEGGADPHRAGAGVDGVVDGLHRARGELLRVGAVVGVHRQGAARLHLRLQRRDVVLRHGEDHRDRVDLRHHHQAVGLRGGDVVAGVDLSQADAAVDRRADVAVGDVLLGGRDLALVGQHVALILADHEYLIFSSLRGDALLALQQLVAVVVELRLVQEVQVARQVALVLGQRRLVEAGIDQGELVALVHLLALLEVHLQQVAGQLRLHRDGGERGHGAEFGQHHRHVAGARLRHADRLWPGRYAATPMTVATRAAGRTRGVAGVQQRVGDHPDRQEEHEQRDPATPPPGPRRSRDRSDGRGRGRGDGSGVARLARDMGIGACAISASA